MLPSHRALLLELFAAALRAVNGRAATRAALAALPQPSGRIVLLAVGKAAASMAQGAYDAWSRYIDRALIVSKDGHLELAPGALQNARCIEAGHPLPDERSLAAGAAVLACVAGLARDETPLFLVSGGSSSLIEQLRPGHGLGELRELTDAALGGAVGIAELNRRRTALSQIKGGGVTRALGGRAGLALFISDVPGDDPAVIGSGWLAPLAGTAPDALVRRVVARLGDAVDAIEREARHRGLDVARALQRFDADAGRLGEQFARELIAGADTLRLWYGESVVCLPPRPGLGGRNQHLALSAAKVLRGCDDALLLAAGTDGSDGVTDDAGALVDGGTWDRSADAGVDPDAALAVADSGRALAASCDLIHTGPTGTNVGDIVIGLKLSGSAVAPARGSHGQATGAML